MINLRNNCKQTKKRGIFLVLHCFSSSFLFDFLSLLFHCFCDWFLLVEIFNQRLRHLRLVHKFLFEWSILAYQWILSWFDILRRIEYFPKIGFIYWFWIKNWIDRNRRLPRDNTFRLCIAESIQERVNTVFVSFLDNTDTLWNIIDNERCEVFQEKEHDKRDKEDSLLDAIHCHRKKESIQK